MLRFGVLGFERVEHGDRREWRWYVAPPFLAVAFVEVESCVIAALLAKAGLVAMRR